MKLLIFSPIPPQKTGTADYLGQILKEMRLRGVDQEQAVILVDPINFERHTFPDLCEGFKVLPHTVMSDVVEKGQVRVFTLANNTFHSYCFRRLALQRTRDRGQIFSIIHEPSCFMLLNNICHNGIYGFSPSHLRKMGEVQLGEFSAKIVDDLNAGNLHWTTEYSLHFQQLALLKSGHVLTHSLYAALKLTLESNLPANDLPQINVYGHPSIPVRSHATQAQPTSAMFRVGVFGWVSRAKRVEQVVEGFKLFLYTLSAQEKQRVELIIVGAAPDAGYQPAAFARAAGIENNVKIYGYVTPNELDDLTSSCSLIFNLRFPSCGETSGTLHKANDLGIPVVSTAYQAFRELPAARRVSVDPRSEVLEIRDAMRDFHAGTASHPEHPTNFNYTSIVEKLIELAEVRHGG